jgi:RNA polymerase sigma factor for flagellar operon FliA
MTREETILSLAPNVNAIAALFARRVPRTVLVAELRSVAWIGAIHAVDRYDCRRKVSLAAFAQLRIRGEILDYLRRLDHLTRGERTKLKSVGAVQPVVVSLDSKTRHDQQVPTAFLRDHRAQRQTETAEARILTEGLFLRASLPARTEDVIRRFYEGEKQGETAAVLGVSRGRVSIMRKNGEKALAAWAFQ